MAAEDPDDLTDQQVSTLRTALEELARELETTIARGKSGAKPVTLDQSAVGRVSRVDALQQQQMTAANQRSAELRRDQVKAALRAMEEGEYGYCRKCDEPIGFKRLFAKPESPFCVRCQRGRER